jgi:hypothetical protein
VPESCSAPMGFHLNEDFVCLTWANKIEWVNETQLPETGHCSEPKQHFRHAGPTARHALEVKQQKGREGGKTCRPRGGGWSAQGGAEHVRHHLLRCPALQAGHKGHLTSSQTRRSIKKSVRLAASLWRTLYLKRDKPLSDKPLYKDITEARVELRPW